MPLTEKLSNLGTRALRYSQGAFFVTIPHAFFNNINHDEIKEIEFFLLPDLTGLIMKPVFKTSVVKIQEVAASIAVADTDLPVKVGGTAGNEK